MRRNRPVAQTVSSDMGRVFARRGYFLLSMPIAFAADLLKNAPLTNGGGTGRPARNGGPPHQCASSCLWVAQPGQGDLC